ncbi:acetyl-coenzyme A transporter 1-like isoform X2 [Apostichopus japonicus]|uniref:acetyl-coenzyme A transporter 1-like isoform X2 n=1 Tax=Stichopus japonicus TaxID=307972 RepID=UPI003AB46F17
MTARRRNELEDSSDMYDSLEMESTETMPLSNSQNDVSSHRSKKDDERDEKRDRTNIAVLVFLYVLQGIPLGLSGSIPLILSSRHVSYKEQAMFSFVYWPFSLKLCWAPIVDAVYSNRFGRRKSWLVPTQYLIGAFMMILSRNVHVILGDGDETASPNVVYLTCVFFMLNFLAATQDIAVDGWALTMLSQKNVGYASTCNSVGQTAGYFLGNVLFLALESAPFCNKYLRWEPQPTGLVTLEDFLYFWGCVFFVTTTLVAVFKKEARTSTDPHFDNLGIFSAYRQLLKVLKLKYLQIFIVIAMTAKIGFAATDSVTGLKLIEAGVPKEQLALLAVPLVPLQILLPWFISKYTVGPTPLNVFLKAMPFRLLMGLAFASIVWITPMFQTEAGTYPYYYYIILIVNYAIHQITLYSMYVAIMAFNAKISDPKMGGTYMTLLNTVTNLGGNWPSTVALWFVDGLSWKSCQGGEGEGLDCDWKEDAEVCMEKGGWGLY